MRVLFDITHPAHVHFFRHAIEACRARGHEVCLTSRDKDITLALLDELGWEHTPHGRAGSGLFRLAVELMARGTALWRVMRRWKPDVALAIAGTFVAPAGRLSGVPVVTFTDTENATLSNALAFPCSALVVTPACYGATVKRRQIRYKGYHELAYLHPDYFQPDPTILEELGVAPGETYTIVRFVSWGASHDVGHHGLTPATKRAAVEQFSAFGKVFITSEMTLDESLEPYRIAIPHGRIHHALHYASLLYGESATMASEAAMLATPAIYVDDVGRGYTDEQEKEFGMVFNFTESLPDQDRSVAKGVELLARPDLKAQWQDKRAALLAECIDVTRMIVDLAENHEENERHVRNRGPVQYQR